MPLSFAEKNTKLGALRAKRDRLTEELTSIREANPGGIRNVTPGVRQRFENTQTARNNLDEEIEALESEMRDDLATAVDVGNVDRPVSQPTRTDATPGARTRSLAMRTIDNLNRSGMLPAVGAESVERLLSVGTERDQSLAARWAVAAGDEHYMRAFAKLAADPTRGHMTWTPDEGAAYRRASEVRTALNLTGGASMVPLVIDPAIMLTGAGSNNPLRQISRVVRTISNSWNGVTSAGATAEWKTEGSQAADGTPALDDAPIPVFMGDVDATFSYELQMDAMNFMAELGKVIRDAADQLMATAYTTGNGTTQPGGIVTALVGTASEINGLGSEVLAASDPFRLQDALPARFSANASFMTHIATANVYRQMETTNGALQFPELRENPPRLLGKPWYENSNMDGVTLTSSTQNNYLAVYGDFSEFIIVDRVGATMEILPDYGANGRPTGQRHAFLTFRTGSDAPVIEAFRLLDIPTTA